MGELTWWLSPHPDWEEGEDWPEDVPVVRYENGDEIVLIDPLLPPCDDFDPPTQQVVWLQSARAGMLSSLPPDWYVGPSGVAVPRAA